MDLLTKLDGNSKTKQLRSDSVFFVSMEYVTTYTGSVKFHGDYMSNGGH